MKKLTLIALSLFTLLHLSAQEQFGAAIYPVPSGWQKSETKAAVTLDKSDKGNVSKIIITSTENTGVTMQADYLRYRTSKGGANITYSANKGSVVKYEGSGLTSFFSKGSATVDKTTVQIYFYSLSNGTQTFFYLLQTNNNAAVTEFNQFMQALRMEVEENAPSKARRARKAAPACPAAPAPMM